MRIHILGASGSGTTTLGGELARRLGCPHLDSDDFYWLPTDPPYEKPRDSEARLSRLRAAIAEAGDSWVLSGSLCGWGDPLVPLFERIVFLRVRTAVRIARLEGRELAAFGAEALAPGGRMHANHRAFLEWAADYDDGGPEMRSLARHRAWLGAATAPVRELDGESPIDELVKAALA